MQTSDKPLLPKEIVERIKQDADNWLNKSGIFQLGADEITIANDSYITGRQKQLEKDFAFFQWLISYFDCEDFIDEPIWEGMWAGKEIKGTTAELYIEWQKLETKIKQRK